MKTQMFPSVVAQTAGFSHCSFSTLPEVGGCNIVNLAVSDSIHCLITLLFLHQDVHFLARHIVSGPYRSSQLFPCE